MPGPFLLAMLISVQFPLADCRPFLDMETHRLDKPAWPQVCGSYIRGFGGVRKLDPTKRWPGERVFCSGDQAVRFTSDPKQIRDGVREVATALGCAFRRLVLDEPAVARFEIGFTRNRGCLRLRSMGPKEVSSTIRAILQLPMRVAHAGAAIDCEMSECGEHLAAHYLRATTKRLKGKTFNTEPWWISAGDPLLIMQYDSGQIAELPPYCQRVPGTEEWGLEIHHFHFRYKNRPYPVWLLGAKSETLASADEDRLQRLWKRLLKLHVERECLQQILWAVAHQKIRVGPKTESSERLQYYLDKSIETLSRASALGLPQAELQFAQQVDDLIDPDQRGELLQQLHDIRKNLLKKTARAIEAPGYDAKGTGKRPISVFISYSHRDKPLCEQLRTHLSLLRRQGLIQDWYDRGILAGDEWAKAIDERLNSAQVILLLISSDFLASDYCLEIETKAALARLDRKEAIVAPILLRESDWRQHARLRQLEPLPKDFKAIEGRVPIDAAFMEVVNGIRELIQSARLPGVAGA